MPKYIKHFFDYQQFSIYFVSYYLSFLLMRVTYFIDIC